MRTFMNPLSPRRAFPNGRRGSGRQDLNLRPSGPKPDALPDCATPRRKRMMTRRFLPAAGPARKRNFQVLQWVMFDQTPEEGGGSGRLPSINVLGGVLLPCSTEPLTGFFRDGCCNTGPEDRGLHTVCVVLTAPFLA